MADFVAVIRRAVDGLASDTPEKRAKVYEKARAAVRRQLENMNPRPPEDMLLRQMEKLEAAITEVEAEHSEALAPEPEVFAADEPVVPHGGAAPEAAWEAPQHAVAPQHGGDWRHEQHYQPEAVTHHHEFPQGGSGYADEAEVRHETHAPHFDHPAGDHAGHEHVGHEHVGAEHADAGAVWHDEPAADDLHASHAAAHEAAVVASEYSDDPYRAQSYHHEVAAPVAAPEWSEPHFEERAGAVEAQHDEPAVLPVFAPEPGEPVSRHGDPAPAAAPAFNDDWGQLPAASEPVATPATDWHWDDPAPAVADERADDWKSASAADSWGAPSAPSASGAPAFPDLPPLPETFEPEPAPVTRADSAAFDVDGRDNDLRDRKEPVEKDPWSDLEDLIGFNRDDEAGNAGGAAVAGSDADPMAAPARPYRAKPARRRNYGGIIAGVLALLLLAGGGYALWENRDSVGEAVNGLMQTGLTETDAPQQASTPPASDTPANSAEPALADVVEDSTGAGTDNAANGSKFTQRLLADGGEVDEGPGANSLLEQSAEGQSVSQLNAPPAAAAAPAQTQPGAATPPAAPALEGERIFLYEERPGETAPVAVEGAVSWALQRDAGENGRQDPIIQGRINVPGRGLTALLTFKRNSDPSLPASHIIEIVFALPADFDGGGIANVQRVAMKQTEQDRGNVLIAVPARITDDFHMIALNDFADARASNLELLRSRDWIDLPLAYNNGRRALLTLQKGARGQQVFAEAIREWQLASPDAAAATPVPGQ